MSNPDQPKITARRAGLIGRTQRLLFEIEQMFSDAQHWNRVNWDKDPIDPDPDGALGNLRRELELTLVRLR